MIYDELRVCRKCSEKKNVKAFIGGREICRLCWYYLSKQDKELEQVSPWYDKERRRKRLQLARSTGQKV